MIREKMKVGPKGQVVIPKVFRKSLGITPGSKVTFELHRDKLLVKKSTIDAVKIFDQVAKSGKSVKVSPHEYEKELEERFT